MCLRAAIRCSVSGTLRQLTLPHPPGLPAARPGPTLSCQLQGSGHGILQAVASLLAELGSADRKVFSSLGTRLGRVSLLLIGARIVLRIARSLLRFARGSTHIRTGCRARQYREMCGVACNRWPGFGGKGYVSVCRFQPTDPPAGVYDRLVGTTSAFYFGPTHSLVVRGMQHHRPSGVWRSALPRVRELRVCQVDSRHVLGLQRCPAG